MALLSSFWSNFLHLLVAVFGRMLNTIVNGLHRLYDYRLFLWMIVANCITFAFHWVQSTIFSIIGRAIASFFGGLSLTTPSSLAVGEFANFFIDCFALDDFTRLFLSYLSILFLAKELNFFGWVVKQTMRIIP